MIFLPLTRLWCKFLFARAANSRGKSLFEKSKFWTAELGGTKSNFISQDTSQYKNLITHRDLGDLPVARRLKHFHINWGKLTSHHFILNLVQGYQIPFSSKLVQNYILGWFKWTKRKFCRSRDSGNDKKRGNPKSAVEPEPFSKFNICNSKERYRKSSSDKVKEVKQTYTIGALQNERSVSFEGLKEVLHKGD